jgi:hypothetical protein
MTPLLFGSKALAMVLTWSGVEQIRVWVELVCMETSAHSPSAFPLSLSQHPCSLTTCQQKHSVASVGL